MAVSGTSKFLYQELGMERITRVLDVGANPINPAPYSKLLENGGCELFGFEPQKDAYDKLMQEPVTNRTYFNQAVGSGKDKSLYVTLHEGFTSLFKPYRPSLDFLGRFGRSMCIVDEVKLDLVGLDAIDALPLIDLLKIDVQGAEVDIIKTGTRTLADCCAIIVEVRFLRLYENEPMFGDLDVFLRDKGFILHKMLPMKLVMINNSQSSKLRPRRAGSQLIDGDAVYIRDLTHLDDISNDQLKHLAICAACVFESYDLALYAIDQLIARDVVGQNVADRFVDHIPQAIRM